MTRLEADLGRAITPADEKWIKWDYATGDMKVIGDLLAELAQVQRARNIARTEGHDG